MITLAAVVPDLIAEVNAALTSSGHGDLIPQVVSGVIERFSHDPTADAGYIYLVRPKPLLHSAELAAPVAETIPFMEMGFNVDVDHDGHLFGIELLGRPDLFAKLGQVNTL
jgi:uncharacterized protein YuzE